MVTTAHTGAAILYSSAVLIAGFLTMLANDLLAIRDMGILASATLFVAFLADVYLAPAVYLATSRLSVSSRIPDFNRGERPRVTPNTKFQTPNFGAEHHTASPLQRG